MAKPSPTNNFVDGSVWYNCFNIISYEIEAHQHSCIVIAY